MKKVALFFAATTAALAVFCLLQSRKSALQEAQLVALSGESEQNSQELESLQVSEKRAQQQVQTLLLQTEDLAAQVRARQQTEAQAAAVAAANSPAAALAPAGAQGSSNEPGKPAEEKNGFGNFLSKMMQDPETKKFIRDQQRMMMNQLYAPLVKQMALTPDESEQFKDLLADNMIKGAEKATSLFGGSSSNRVGAMAGLVSEQKNLDDELKTFLGDERYAVYKDYQQTVAERTQLNQFKQMNDAGNPLTDQQTEQLLAIMKEEKLSVASTSGEGSPGLGQDQVALQAMVSGEQLEKVLQAQATVSDRVFQRAGQLLSPDQLAAFGKFQTNQLQMMRMGMTMASKFFGSDKTESPVGERQ